jgi:drug/metabolite transporter (DMT)-like permease
LQNVFQKKSGIISIAIFCSFLWGSAFPILKISNVELQMPENSPIAQMVFAGIRFLLAGLIILIYLFMTNRKRLYVKRSQVPVLILLGFLQTAVYYFFFYNGLAKVSGMQGSILSSSETFLTVFLAHFFYKNDRLDWKKTIGILAGLAGIMMANWGQDFQFGFQWTGEGYMIMSGIISAFATILAKELAVDIHPFTLTGWQLTIGSLLLLIIGLPQYNENMITFTPFGWGLLIYAAVISSASFALWYSLLKYNKAGEISIYKFLIPVFGAFLSALLVPGETLNLFIIAALALVAIGILSVNYRGQRREKSHFPMNVKRKHID